MRVSTNTVGSLLDLYRAELAPLFGDPEARAIARTVFRHAFGWDMGELELRRPAALSESELLKVYAPLTRLRKGEPLQYVLGHAWFMGMEVQVAPGVLIPRPETEELVDLIRQDGRTAQRIIDIGTGSGCIALALKRLYPRSQVWAVDVSEEALAIARRNGATQGLDVQWSKLDVLDATASLPDGLDLVVSNPPYVPRSEEPALAAHVRGYEPHLALFVDDVDPLVFYRAIARKAWDALVPGGALWFEGHHHHAAAVGAMLVGSGYDTVSVLNDLSGSSRFIHAIR